MKNKRNERIIIIVEVIVNTRYQKCNIENLFHPENNCYPQKNPKEFPP